VGAGCGGSSEDVLRVPETWAGKKAVFEAGADHLLEVAITQAESLNGADVFVGEVDARDAFVVGGESKRNVELFVNWKRMILGGNSENALVAGEIDFHEDVFCGHVFEKRVRFVFVQDVHAVADALGMAEFDGLADVATETFIGDKTRSEFASMKTDVNFWIEAMEEIEHAHVEGIIGHGDVAVFRHDKIQTDKARVGGSGFEAEQSLSEDDFAGKSTQDLAKKTELNAAGDGFSGLAAMLAIAAESFGAVKGSAGGSDVFA